MARRRRKGGAVSAAEARKIAQQLIQKLPGAAKRGLEIARTVKPLSRGAEVGRALAPYAGKYSGAISTAADVAGALGRVTGTGRRGGRLMQIPRPVIPRIPLPKLDFQKIAKGVATADRLARQIKPVSTAAKLVGYAAPAVGVLSPRVGDALQIGSSIAGDIGNIVGYGKMRRRRGGMMLGTVHPAQIPGSYRPTVVKF